MEAVKGALKSGLTSPEMQQGFWENMGSSPVVQNGAVSEDDFFFVDDLLDFSKAEDDEEKAFVTEHKTENDTVHLSATKLDNFNSPPPVALHENELCLPADELADLEWLSNFVDDSTPSYSLTLPAQKPPPPPKYVETKARTGVRVWPLSESSTSSSSTSHTSPFVDLTHSAESFIQEPAAKKQKKQYVAERRCSHCLVYKTPQWRAGPLGAKTLCNACGVRYKSGRLLPEYRPACSPTFSIEKHSNNHRKVMEMRRKKEDDDGSGGFEKADRRLRIFGVNLF